MIRRIEKIFLLSVFLIISVCVSAQDGTYGAYSPYSIYGIGDISQEGSAFNKSMAKELEWRELVAQGKAREVREPVLNGYRYHFELIND